METILCCSSNHLPSSNTDDIVQVWRVSQKDLKRLYNVDIISCFFSLNLFSLVLYMEV